MIIANKADSREPAPSRRPGRRIRVLCVDDNPLVADAIAMRLALVGGFEWLGHQNSADELSDVVERLHPDVILMDLDMPGKDPFDAIESLSSTQPDVRVLVLSGHVRTELLDRAVEAGAWGYLSKNDDAQSLVSAIRQVDAGEFVLGPAVSG